MGRSFNSRNDTYNVAAGVIVIIGVITFAYIGQQVSQGSNTMSSVIETSRPTLP